MAKVIVTKSKLDALNSAISAKSGAATQRTLDGMTAAVAALPSDTGAAGLYRSMSESDVTRIVDPSITSLRQYAQYNNTSLEKVSLPNLTSVGKNAFDSCSNLTGVVDLGSAVCAATVFKGALRRTAVIKLGSGTQTLASCVNTHVWFPYGYSRTANYEYSQAKWLKTIQYDDMKSSFSFIMCNGLNALEAFVIRKSTLVPLSGTGLSGYDPAVFRFYVPAALADSYRSASNWSTFASLIVGIDEDAACTAGATFTPTAGASGIVSWDTVDLQSYSAGTVDSATGAVATTNDGRLLIRGLDSNGDIKHVTYLQIGSGFDEEANLL